MKSKSMSWINCSNKWFNTVNNTNISPLYDALREANNAITTVEEDGDIGSLSISLTTSDLEDLNCKHRKFTSFCNAIHYEINQLVDNPFSTKIADALEEIYALNPSDFKTSAGKFLWFDKITSLTDLIKSTIIDDDLKKDFDKKADSLDNDEISDDLKDSIKEARFWEDEFDKSNECQKIAGEVFTPEIRDAWPSMSEADKKAVIQDYVNKLGNALFEEPNTTVKYDANGYGYSSVDNPTNSDSFEDMIRAISVNKHFIDDSTGEYSIDNLIDTLTHEARHQYQAAVKLDPDKYNIPSGLLDDWNSPYISTKNNPYDDYYRQGVESDARGFAALSNPDN